MFDPLADTAEHQPMTVSYWTTEAARRLNRHSARVGYGDFDPGAWFPWILEVIAALVQCRPSPQDGYDYLSWRPLRVFDPFGWRLQRHRNSVRDAINRVSVRATGPVGLVGACDSLFAAIDAGDLDVPLMKGLYEAAR